MKERKRLSKSKITQQIIDYVFRVYCDDEEIALLAQDYYEAEKKLNERRNKRNPRKQRYKISQEVRDFLEPLVDAEYIKTTVYKLPQKDDVILYLAMEELHTKQNSKLLKKLKRDRNSDDKERV